EDIALTAEKDDDSDDEPAANTGNAAADPNPRVALESSLVPIEESPLAQYEARTQYWSENGVHSSDPDHVVSVEEDDEAVDIDYWFEEDDSQIDTNERGDFKSAREAYINAHVNDRFADISVYID